MVDDNGVVFCLGNLNFPSEECGKGDECVTNVDSCLGCCVIDSCLVCSGVAHSAIIFWGMSGATIVATATGAHEVGTGVDGVVTTAWAVA